jgi:hypothetical protein
MLATILTALPQRLQIVISILNTRLSRCAQLISLCPSAGESEDAMESGEIETGLMELMCQLRKVNAADLEPATSLPPAADFSPLATLRSSPASRGLFRVPESRPVTAEP